MNIAGAQLDGVNIEEAKQKLKRNYCNNDRRRSDLK